MKTKKTIAAIAAIALAPILALSACASGTNGGSGNGDAKEKLSVIVVTPYLGNATTKEAIDDLKAQGTAKGWDVSVVDTAGDMNQLNSAFQNAAAQKPAAIVMAAGDPTQVSLGLKAASDAGVPVFAFDAAVAEGIAANVTSDNSDLGQTSAKELVKLMGGKGSIVMLTHDPHPGVKLRAEGARQVFKDAGIKVLESKHVNVPGPVDDARASVQDLISALGDKINGIWAGWDEPALGATQALDAAGVKGVPVVGVDGQEFALAEMKKGGPFKATVKQDWKAITAKVVELIQAKVVDGKDPGKQQYELAGQLITVDSLG
jgi:ribose transport system substrate-binding protein